MDSKYKGKPFLEIIIFITIVFLFFGGCETNEDDDDSSDDLDDDSNGDDDLNDDDNNNDNNADNDTTDDDAVDDDDAGDDDDASIITIHPQTCLGDRDPCEWEEIASFDPPIGLYGIWGAAEDDIYAVGGNPDYPASPFVLHFNGADWQPIAVPGEEVLLTVWGFSASDIYAGGGAYTRGLLLHYDGNEWTQDPYTDFWYRIHEIWGSAPDDLYAAGAQYIFHYNGTSWTYLTGFPEYINSYGSLWGRSAAEVYLASSSYEDEGHYAAYFLRFNGSSWNPMPGWNRVIYTQNPGDFWGSPTGEIYYADWYLHYFDGSSWQRPLYVQGESFVALWGSSVDDLYAASDGYIMHSDGEAWCHMTPFNEDWDIQDLWGTPGGDVYAVGTINHDEGGILLRCSPSAKN